MSFTRCVAGTVLVVALVALAGCGTAGIDTPTFAPTTTAGDAPTTVDSGPERYALGETVALEQANTTIEVSVVDYQLVERYEAPAESGSGTRTVEAPPGQQFVLVKLTVENVGDTDGSTPSVSVRPNNESADAPEAIPAASTDGRYRSVRPLPAGETTTGWYVVQASTDVAVSDVRVAFSPDILVTEDEFRWTLVERDDEE